MKKKMITVLLAASMCMGLAVGAYAEEGTEKVFRYSTTAEPTTLDPSKVNAIADNEIQHAATESLVRNTAGDVQPGLAESWEVSDDGLTYTFHLRDSAWSDGQPIVAGDFVYSFQRLMDPETASLYAFIGECIKNGVAVESGELPVEELGVSAPDDKTLVVELEAPTAYFLSMIGSQAQFAPLRQDVVEEWGTDFAATAEKNVYSGPFKITSTDNKVVTFEPNEYYWNAEAVNWDRVELYTVEEASTALMMYEEGSLDYAKIPTEQVANYTGDSRHHEYMNGNEDYLYINVASEDCPLLGNKNFRMALNYAIDRNTYIALATSNVYLPTNTLVMPLVAGVNSTYGEEFDLSESSYPMDGDAAKAVEYLNAALEEEGIASASDVTLEFVTTDNETNKKIAEVIQEMWQSVLGITVDIRQVTYGEIYSTVYPTSDYQVGYAGWGPDYSDPYSYLGLFESSFTSYGTNYANPEVDEYLEYAKTEPDAQKRMEALNSAEKLILEDAAFVPLQLRQEHYLLDEDVTGVEFYFCSVNIDWVFGDMQQ